MTSSARKTAERTGNLDGFLAKKHRAQGFHIEKAARESALRGAAKSAALYVIDGQYLTAEQLATRLRTEKGKAVARYSRAKGKPGPMTWEKLGAAP